MVRAAHYAFPLMLAIIGGEPMRFAPYVDLYHRALAEFGQDTQPVGVHSHGYVAATDRQASLNGGRHISFLQSGIRAGLAKILFELFHGMTTILRRFIHTLRSCNRTSPPHTASGARPIPRLVA